MKITWLGHSGFRIEIEDAILLIDPWLTGNPMFPEARRAEATAGATHVLVTHGHGDHTGDAVSICRAQDIPVAGTYDLVSHWEATEGIAGIGFNKGGTIEIGGARVTLVSAAHSSSLSGPAGPVYAGHEAGFMIAGEGHTVYVSGDTTVMADMGWMGEYFAPDIGILSCGGHYTMDMRMAAWAARKYFAFKTVIPCHYRTFPILAQSAGELKVGLPGVDVIEPEVLVPITL